MTTTHTPIALFTYNRPQHVGQALQSLSQCARLNECRLYIFCDGSKSPAQNAAVEASRHVVHQWSQSLGAVVVERPRNLGLARSIVSGVTDLCREYGRVIVVEDDQEFSPGFLHYMLHALDRYDKCREVYQISGYMFPTKHPVTADAFFLPLSTTWGWATWDRAWRIFDWKASGAREQLANPEVRRRFNLDNAYPFAEMLEARFAEQNDSWGILFWWAVFRAEGLVLHPRQSFVWVRGFDGSGTHCGNDVDYPLRYDAVMSMRLSDPPIFPEALRIDDGAFDRVKEVLRSRRTTNQTLVHRARRYARKLSRRIAKVSTR